MFKNQWYSFGTTSAHPTFLWPARPHNLPHRDIIFLRCFYIIIEGNPVREVITLLLPSCTRVTRHPVAIKASTSTTGLGKA